jgi:hypothetical protein
MRKTNNQILINKNALAPNLLKASFFVLAFSVIFYIYINISTVFALIDFKKSNLSLDKKGQELSKLESEVNSLKYSLKMSDAVKIGLTKVENSNFIVRKDDVTMFSINYESDNN